MYCGKYGCTRPALIQCIILSFNTLNAVVCRENFITPPAIHFQKYDTNRILIVCVLYGNEKLQLTKQFGRWFLLDYEISLYGHTGTYIYTVQTSVGVSEYSLMRSTDTILVSNSLVIRTIQFKDEVTCTTKQQQQQQTHMLLTIHSYTPSNKQQQ